MKYGESSFDVLYLLFAAISGIVMLCRAKDRAGRLMGAAALVLGCGDAFHLVPRVLRYFIASDFTVALGVGKLVTSVTMTVFYIMMYVILTLRCPQAKSRFMTVAVWALSAVRVILCLFPQNGWFENESGVLWGVIRNVPFTLLGVLIVVLYFRFGRTDRSLRRIWLYVTLSFLFYLPVAVGASLVPMLGMLMLPKTVCYILMIVAFLKAVFSAEKADQHAPGM